MSVFDVIKNNRGVTDAGVYMAYKTFEDYLLMAQKDEREDIIKQLKAEIERVSEPMMVDREYLDGLEKAIAIIEVKNTSKVSSADTFEVEMLPKYWGCVTCGQEYQEDANWCRRCQTYKNFDWIGE